MPTSTLTYATEDARNGWTVGRLGDGMGAAKHPGEPFQCGFDGSLSKRGLLTLDLASLTPAIPAGATITAARFIGGPMDTFIGVRFYVGTGNPWALSALAAWNAIANGALDVEYSAEDMTEFYDDQQTGMATVPLGTTAQAALQSALGGAGLFWLGMLNDEVNIESFAWSFEDPWPSIEVDWTESTGKRRLCMPPMPPRRRHI